MVNGTFPKVRPRVDKAIGVFEFGAAHRTLALELNGALYTLATKYVGASCDDGVVKCFET